MLTISKPLSSGQARSYHEKEFANAEQNYYSQKGAVQGEWTGKLAAEWGLAGAVGAVEFERLAEGQHPVTGYQMVQHRVSRTYTNERGETITTADHRAEGKQLSARQRAFRSRPWLAATNRCGKPTAKA